MSICTFFGHHDCPPSVKPKLREVVVNLIENRSVELFYVGNHGAFDRIVSSVLQEMKRIYPQIQCFTVLSRMPGARNGEEAEAKLDTLLPEGIEAVPPRFAISYCNQWMVQQSDIVVTYVTHTWGGAAKYAEMAERRGKTVIKLAQRSANM